MSLTVDEDSIYTYVAIDEDSIFTDVGRKNSLICMGSTISKAHIAQR